MQRYLPPTQDPIDQLRMRIASTTLQADGDQHDGDDDASFFDLPEASAIADKDPELL